MLQSVIFGKINYYYYEAGIGLQRARYTTASLEDPTGTPSWENEFVPAPLRPQRRGLCQTCEAYRILAQISGPWFCPCCPFPSMLAFLRISFSCSSSNNSEMIPGHLHTCFPRNILCETLERRIPKSWWTVRVQTRALVNSHFHIGLFIQ